jgi:SpoVK/Ycf46/Vps4 family AAA+-type ATPase
MDPIGNNPDFQKLKARITETQAKFQNAETEKEKSKAFTAYTKLVDQLTNLENTPEADDLIFECIIQAKKMRTEIAPKKPSEDKVTNFLRMTLFELEPEIKWADIIGLKLHREYFLKKIILPLKTKKFGECANGALLFGPSGNGKTMLGKAMAYETEATFFYVSCLTLLHDKFREESEKILKAIFEKAGENKPSVVMFDEMEAFYPEKVDNFDMGRFDQNLFEQIQNSRQIFEGLLESVKSVKEVCVFGATNQPWVLPEEVFSYFDLRLILDVPEQETRVAFCKKSLKKFKFELDENEYNQMGQHLKG